jgi:hypothetical protein
MISPEKRHQIMTEFKHMTLQNKQEFSVIMRYFFDHLVDTGLLEQYKQPIDKSREGFFTVMVNPILKYFKGPVKVIGLALDGLEGEAFTHGVVALSNHQMLSLFFFDDVNTGLVSFSNDKGGMEFFRITAFQGTRPEGAGPMNLVPGSRSVN